MGHAVIFSYSEHQYVDTCIVPRSVLHRLMGKSKCCRCTAHCLWFGGRTSHMLLFVCVLQSRKCPVFQVAIAGLHFITGFGMLGSSILMSSLENTKWISFKADPSAIFYMHSGVQNGEEDCDVGLERKRLEGGLASEDTVVVHRLRNVYPG